MSSIKRIEKLDSLRGLAALTVFFFHSFNVFWNRSDSLLWKIIANTPLKILWAGHEAVILFFLLSGIVLSLPYFNGKQNNYSTFLTKRFFRIYIPYIIAVLFSCIARLLWSNGNIAGVWNGKITLGLIINHIFLIGTFNTLAIDPVIWSLIHEFRISLIFPLLMYFLINHGWKKIITIGVIISCFGITISSYALNHIDQLSNYFITFHYLLMFILGSLLAKHKNYLKKKINNIHVIFKVIILFLGTFLYCYSNRIAYHVFGHFFNEIIISYLADWLIAIGGAIFILITISDSKMFAFLTKKPFLFMGKISYSFYLFHLPILLIIYCLVNNSTPTLFSISLSLLISLIVSSLSYRYIEYPSMKMGKSLTLLSNIKRKKAS